MYLNFYFHSSDTDLFEEDEEDKEEEGEDMDEEKDDDREHKKGEHEEEKKEKDKELEEGETADEVEDKDDELEEEEANEEVGEKGDEEGEEEDEEWKEDDVEEEDKAEDNIGEGDKDPDHQGNRSSDDEHQHKGRLPPRIKQCHSTEYRHMLLMARETPRRQEATAVETKAAKLSEEPQSVLDINDFLEIKKQEIKVYTTIDHTFHFRVVELLVSEGRQPKTIACYLLSLKKFSSFLAVNTTMAYKTGTTPQAADRMVKAVNDFITSLRPQTLRREHELQSRIAGNDGELTYYLSERLICYHIFFPVELAGMLQSGCIQPNQLPWTKVAQFRNTIIAFILLSGGCRSGVITNLTLGEFLSTEEKITGPLDCYWVIKVSIQKR
ncbi:hypothetical protein HOLleu_43951 [Holothuria leucospilota]|uniref:Uncharacterized protein n=1 Tax=Holothuria leucospilota TaxID=206669 RepID=A0A9Q1BB76_HOLLE|nr:hypothetical protein HOLleu_43951 [Holothuria leucospilota]